MVKKHFFLAITSFVAILVMTSCSSQSMMIPQAVNTINSIGLDELRLNHATDYTILKTISAEASVIFTTQRKGEQVNIEEENGEFKIVFTYDKKRKEFNRSDYEGIAHFGFLTNDYGRTYTDVMAPEYVSRNIAMYRIINAAKIQGADGIIEPIVSTNVEQRGKHGKEIVFRTTVSGKPMKLNVDGK